VRFLADHVDFYAFGGREAALQFLSSSQVRISLDTLPNYEMPAPGQQLARCVTVMRELGLDLIAIDLTQDVATDVGLKVVKVLVPQLIPISFGHQRRCLGGSRLYDVSVKLGFRRTPCTIHELNPDPHPFG
jgi:ribosomal protein S12 methylthiotransferase accessory factor